MKRKQNVEYVTRYGVYAVIPDEKKEKLFWFRHPTGLGFCLGGDLKEGKTIRLRLNARADGRTGFTAQLGRHLGQADEYFYSRHRDTYFYNPAYLYEVTFQEVQKPLEDFNQLAWFPVEEAIGNTQTR